MQATQLTREFRYNGVRLADPSPQFTLEQVRDFYANTYPEILNADIDGPTTEGTLLVYGFRRAVGRKGTATASLHEQVATGSLYIKNQGTVPPGQLDHPVAKVLLSTCGLHRDRHAVRGTALMPTSASLQVLA